MQDRFFTTVFSRHNSPQSALQEIELEIQRLEQELQREYDSHELNLPSIRDAEPHLESLRKLLKSQVHSGQNRNALFRPWQRLFKWISGHLVMTLLLLGVLIWGSYLLTDIVKTAGLPAILSYTIPLLVLGALVWQMVSGWRERELDLADQYDHLVPVYFTEHLPADEFPYRFASEWQEQNHSQTWRFEQAFDIKRHSIAFDIRRDNESIGLIFRETEHKNRYQVFLAASGIQFTLGLPGAVRRFFEASRKQVEAFHAGRAEYSPLENRKRQLQLIQSIALDQETLFELFSTVARFVDSGAEASRGLLLLGPPGTGKSYIAKVIAEVAGIAFYEHTLSSLKSANVGGSAQNVKQAWNLARQNQPAVIFIDECDSIFAKRGGNNEDSFTSEIVNSFLPEWDGMQSDQAVLVIGATNRPQTLDTAIKSRFTSSFTIDLPDAAARVKILLQEAAKRGIVIHDIDHDKIGEATLGMSGRELVNTTQKLLLKTDTDNNIHCQELIELIAESNRDAKAGSKDARWDRLVLAPKTKQDLLDLSSLMENYDRLIEKFGNANIPKGILLYGPPGTGKTQIARTLANESKVNFIARSGADIRGKYVGHSANNVKQLFAEAREKSPCIVFVDEIDTLASRDEGSSTIDRETLGEFLTQMDGFASSADRILVIAATNVIDQIDSALLSRFPRQVEIPLPGAAEREQLYFTFLSDLEQFLEDGLDLLQTCKHLARQSEGTSGRKIFQDVKRLANDIQLEYLKTDQDPTLNEADLLTLIDTQ